MILDKIINTIVKYDMIKKGISITAAVSGGADSVALLYILKSLKSRFEFELFAVHINHHLRGQEADRDEKFVIDLCKKLEVPIKIFHADINKISANTKEGIEECARRIRYEFFETLGTVATAHTLSDTIETIIFNLTRGTGIKGLIGIPPVRDFVIRPLCECTRREIEEYLDDIKATFVIDSTNLTDDYTRNKIRHNIIPVLSEINSSLESSVFNMSELLRDDSKFLNELANKEYIKNPTITELIKMPNALRSRIIIRKAMEIGITLDFKHTNNILKIIDNGGRCQLPNGYFAENYKDTLRLVKSVKNISFNIPFKEGIIKTPYEQFECIVVSNNEFHNNKKVYNLLFKNVLDYGKIKAISRIRSRMPGDKFMPENHKFHKSFKNLVCENDIPCDKRNQIAILESDGEIMWVSGIGRSQICVPNENTKQFLIIKECC